MMSTVVHCWSPPMGQDCCCPSCPTGQVLWPVVEGEMAVPAATGQNSHWEACKPPGGRKTQDRKRARNKAEVGWGLPKVIWSVSFLGRRCVHANLSPVLILRRVTSGTAYLSQPLLPEGRGLCPVSEPCPEN